MANQNSSNPSSGVAHAHELCYRPLPRTLRPLIRTAGTRCRIITQPADDAISIAKANAYNEKHKLLLTALIQVYALRTTALCLAKPVSDSNAVVDKRVPRTTTSARRRMCHTEHSAIWLLPPETIYSKSAKAATMRYAYGCSKKQLTLGKEVCLMLASTSDKLAMLHAMKYSTAAYPASFRHIRQQRVDPVYHRGRSPAFDHIVPTPHFMLRKILPRVRPRRHPQWKTSREDVGSIPRALLRKV